jgi:hypothetical protein
MEAGYPCRPDIIISNWTEESRYNSWLKMDRVNQVQEIEI